MTSSSRRSIDRRKFMQISAASALGFTILPRHVLGGKNYVAPSDTLNFAYIGTGTEGIREIFPFLSTPNVRVVAICDPQKDAIGYKDWSPNGTKNQIRAMIKKANWEPGGDNTIPGGRECGKSIVETYYANNHPEYKYKECKAYADVRELFDKEKGIDAIKIMTPDHLHGVLCMAAMKRGKHVMVHKPLSNRLLEGKKVIEYARNSKVITHLTPWDANGSMDQVMTWINAGVIGNLKEIHNWTNRPVWPQYDTLPTDNPPIPFGFDWDLWLGPEADRSYSPNYTNMVFRGWYDFGGGSMADMGHYSLWVVFKALQLEKPTLVVPNYTHVTAFNGVVPFQIQNDFSFPTACSVRFKYPANGSRGPVDLIWYDGGIRPAIPDELLDQNKELQPEGMMFVGDKGKILAGFHVDNPQILSGTHMESATPAPHQSEV
ncbi:MAG TPA: Gfo/Idh/MocA family oxidoreductase, partial [Puia sp.]|nr:Gfo/Idh/MocA family oxidoreductase [Puia sp.]